MKIFKKREIIEPEKPNYEITDKDEIMTKRNRSGKWKCGWRPKGLRLRYWIDEDFPEEKMYMGALGEGWTFIDRDFESEDAARNFAIDALKVYHSATEWKIEVVG